MHPDVRQEGPGRCPKCGMDLVKDSGSKKSEQHGKADDKGLGPVTWKSYIPLIVIVALIVVVSAVASWSDLREGRASLAGSLGHFMAGFFIVFAGFKLMDLHGFAHGYATYDLLAQKVPAYGYVFPFIELGFGLAMLAGMQNAGLLWAEAVVMAFSGLGVTLKLMKREKVQCSCLGTFLKVPLTKVTVIENFGMAALALLMLFLLA